MEKRAVLAIVLSLVVVVLWSIFFAPASLPPPSEVSEPALSPSEPPAGVGTPQPAAPVSPGLVSSTVPTSERPPGAPAAQEVLVTVDTGVARFTLTSQGASVRAVQLQAYHTTLAKGAPPIEIAPVPGSTTLPLHAELSMEQRVIALGQVVFTPSQTEVTLSASQPEARWLFVVTSAMVALRIVSIVSTIQTTPSRSVHGSRECNLQREFHAPAMGTWIAASH